MNYNNIYKSIIDKYGCQSTGIVERHHILPRSMGGTDSADNIVEVSPRVHYILHLLLYKMTEGNDKKKMWYAIWNMSNQGKVKTGSMYQFIREGASKRQRDIIPRVPWNKGIKGYKINQRQQKGIPKPYKRKKIVYDNVEYSSIQEACKATGKSYYIITNYGNYIQP